MMAEPLAILFEDAHCLAVAKPPGLLTQGVPGREPALQDRVFEYLGGRSSASTYVGTVHRLDRPVSGVVLFAKTPRAARRLAAQFAERHVRKEYWAIVQGDASAIGDSGVWDDWLAPPDATGRASVVLESVSGSRRAVTRFARGEGAVLLPDGMCWLRLWPETGRTHQLRAQAAARGLSIAGDVAYGSTRNFAEGIALHAWRLEFRHPVLRDPVAVVAPIPSEWARFGIVVPEAGPGQS